MHSFNLKEKVILITGGYGHLGSAITESLLYHNARVIVLGRSITKHKAAFKAHNDLHFKACDISSSESINRVFEEIYEEFNRIDVLINNAYYMKGQSPEEITDEEWQYSIDGTLNSTYKTIRAIIPYMKKQGFGKIINLSSMYGMVAPQFEVYDDFPEYLNPPHYGAAKAGVLQLTRYFASHLGKLGIQINAVSPGPFPSEKVQESEGFIKNLSEKTCLNRIGKPEDLAGAFVYLSSDASNYVTGQNLVVDGGWTAK